MFALAALGRRRRVCRGATFTALIRYAPDEVFRALCGSLVAADAALSHMSERKPRSPIGVCAARAVRSDGAAGAAAAGWGPPQKVRPSRPDATRW